MLPVLLASTTFVFSSLKVMYEGAVQSNTRFGPSLALIIRRQPVPPRRSLTPAAACNQIRHALDDLQGNDLMIADEGDFMNARAAAAAYASDDDVLASLGNWIGYAMAQNDETRTQASVNAVITYCNALRSSG